MKKRLCKDESKSKSAFSKEKYTYVSLIAVALAITLFACLLSASLKWAFNPDTEYKTVKNSMDTLVSVGAPQSKLNLQRIFSAMSHSYTDVDGVVYEPISREYRLSVEEKIRKKEKFYLSVEEIIYIISDTYAMYDSCDIIRLRSFSGDVEKEIRPKSPKQNWQNPLHIAYAIRLSDIAQIIEYRIKALTSDDAVSYDESIGRIYHPLQVGKGTKNQSEKTFDKEKCFVFSEKTDVSGRETEITFKIGKENSSVLFPKEKDAQNMKTKVIYDGAMLISEQEKELLENHGFDAYFTKNVTPEYFYQKTSARLFVNGGELFLADTKNGFFEKVLGNNEKLLSAAILYDGEKDGYTVFFSILKDNVSYVMSYNGDEIKNELLGENQLLVLAETTNGAYDAVCVYRGKLLQSEKYISCLRYDNEIVHTFKN